jgi:TatD DNase family protein
MLIDTHAHVNFVAFKEDSEKVIKRALKEGVWMINVGSQWDTSKRAVTLAEKFKKGVFAAIGLHPIHLETKLVKIKIDREEVEFKTAEEYFDKARYQKLAQSKKVVAIGEIGLDYYWRPKTKKKLELFKEKQKESLIKQIELAQEFNLPIIFHCRMAHSDLLEVISLKFKASNLRGVIHCFTGTWEQAQKYLELGLYLGFNGLIFKKNFDEIIKKTPLKRILLETDCPYLAPPPFEGQRNEPRFLKYIAEKIAHIKAQSVGKIAKVTTQNARELFSI